MTTDALGYAVKFESVAVGAGAFTIRSLRDRQQYADPLGAAAAAGVSPAMWPIFGLLWPSARVLADAMLAIDIEGLRVLEVGCGLGLASLVLQRRRGDITASDCHPLAQAFLDANTRLNDLAPLKYAGGAWARSHPALGRFDLIIGSDVLYGRDHPEALAGFIERHAKPLAQVIIIDPNRGNRAAFTRRMQAQGYALTQTRVLALPGSDEAYRGRMLDYRR